MDVNQITLKRIRKELDESNNYYEGRASWKPDSNFSYKKRTTDFLCDTGHDWLLYSEVNQVHSLGHGNFGVFFRGKCMESFGISKQDMKGTIFITEWPEERSQNKLVKQIRPSIKRNTFSFISHQKKILMQMMNPQNKRWLALSLQDIPIMMTEINIKSGTCCVYMR